MAALPPRPTKATIETSAGKREVYLVKPNSSTTAISSERPRCQGENSSIEKPPSVAQLLFKVHGNDTAPVTISPPVARNQTVVSSMAQTQVTLKSGIQGILSSQLKAWPPTGTTTVNSGFGGDPVLRLPLDYEYREKRSIDKSKGLRHFSTKVCEKVREKGITNYNEVADELVQEYFESMQDTPSSHEKQLYDQKNIRRRVYDALNVLMAMNIITKDKKEIRWVGLPTSSAQECTRLEVERRERLERIKQKAEQLKDSIIKLVATKALIERNRISEGVQGKPLPQTTLSLPYVIITTDKKTEVDCSISMDKTEYWFKFNQPFEILEDADVLKRLGLSLGLEKGKVKEQDIPKIKSYLPASLREYVDRIVHGDLIDKFLPVSMQRKSFLSRAFEQMEDKSRSLDAADMEVAFTLSKNDSTTGTGTCVDTSIAKSAINTGSSGSKPIFSKIGQPNSFVNDSGHNVPSTSQQQQKTTSINYDHENYAGPHGSSYRSLLAAARQMQQRHQEMTSTTANITAIDDDSRSDFTEDLEDSVDSNSNHGAAVL